MGALRSSLRAYALEGHGPAGVLQRLDRLVDLERDGMATLVYLVIEPDLTSMRVASAGHLPPLVIAPDGDTSFLAAHGSVPLGVGGGHYEETVVSLEPSSTLLLFTDGLVEQRGESIEVGLERMRRALTGSHRDPEVLCDTLLRALGRENGTSDDVTLLAVGTVAVAPDPLRLVLPADPKALASMRRRLGRWLEELGASEDELYEIQVAANEACGNAIEHGWSFGEGTLELEATRNGNGVVIVVRDQGGWREPQESERGRGLLLMRSLMASVELETGSDGTSVELRRGIDSLAERAPVG
jgi:anti-sigma regulatory factor (Ser/Thr protein kinase)